MRAFVKAASLAGAAAILIGGGALMLDRPSRAADHLDPPERTNVGTMSDTAADIADIFTWHTDSTVTIVMTFAGPKESGVGPTYDSNVLYQLHLSNDGDVSTDEATINMRFGRDPNGDWGVQFVGVPGSNGPIEGAVQTELDQGSVKAESGLFDDPFFFDLQGFNDTKASGTLSIMNNRNFFAGKNDTAFVVEFPRSAIANGTHPITIWGETRRIAAGG